MELTGKSKSGKLGEVYITFNNVFIDNSIIALYNSLYYQVAVSKSCISKIEQFGWFLTFEMSSQPVNIHWY